MLLLRKSLQPAHSVLRKQLPGFQQEDIRNVPGMHEVHLSVPADHY